MNRRRFSFVRRILYDKNGQVMPWFAFMLTLFLGMGGLVMDVGRCYFSHNELQSSTDAAALAGAQILPNSGATTEATLYSSVSTSDNNSYSNLPSVSMVPGYPLLKCLTSLSNIGIPCVAPSNANAIQVKQESNVPTYFGRLFGVNSITVAASATAAMRGTATVPYNVAVIIDTTASMSDSDSDSSCNSTRLSCELSGVQTMLLNMAPCVSALTTCGSTTANSYGGGSNVSNPVDEVALFTFPPPSTATVSKDYACTGANPTIVDYQYPTTTATAYAPPGPAANFITPSTQPEYNGTYMIVNYSSDYKTSGSATTLNSSSDIVKAIGGVSGCPAVSDPGGDGTYYAGAIYAAQASLVAELAARPGSQNVIVLVSDGDATSSQTQMGSTAGGATSSGTYPSWNDECTQAVLAGQAATTAKTNVYAVSYGSESSGCTTDSGAYTPCTAMKGIASSTSTFYSDYAQSGSGADTSCVGTAAPTTNLTQIFTDIAGTFSVARLIPDSAT
jgi:Flp pilus assembly protein TadG